MGMIHILLVTASTLTMLTIWFGVMAGIPMNTEAVKYFGPAALGYLFIMSTLKASDILAKPSKPASPPVDSKE